MSSLTPVTVGSLVKFAKNLRIQAYYDIGDPHADSEDRSSVIREARTSTLTAIADMIDTAFGVDSALTQEDLEDWRKP